MKFPALCLLTLLCLPACAAREADVLPEESLRIAIAGFSQPGKTADLLAGSLPAEAGLIPLATLARLDQDFADLLDRRNGREFINKGQSARCVEKNPRSGTQSAFNHWLQVGACLQADILILPQVIFWQEADEENPARIILDIFLLDIRGKSLLARSHYDTRYHNQDAGRTAVEKSEQEGLLKAIKEFGL